MKEIIAFFKDIFMLEDQNSNMKVGLSQFKEENLNEVKKVKKVKKVSDLMRKSA